MLLMSLFLAAACPAAESLAPRFARLNACTDEVCRVTAADLRSGSEKDGENVLWMWSAMAKDSVPETKDGFVRVDFTLVPEAGSDIRCRMELPLPGKWDGRLWGVGNSGHAGVLPQLRGYSARGTAAMTTDLGTARVTNNGRTNARSWPANVHRDYGYRATHLMTVYGKRMAEAFYGRRPDHVYFIGGSCGGRQAMSEAIRYPDDYEGIIAGLPGNNAVLKEIAIWHLRRLTHDASGAALFTTNELRVVSDAAVEYMAPRTPKPYAGKCLADARLSEKDIEGFIRLAVEKCPSLGKGDRPSRLKALFMPLVIDGQCWYNGFAPGAYQGKQMGWMGIATLAGYLKSKGITSRDWDNLSRVTPDLMRDFLREIGPDYNSASYDLSSFRKRGGKLIMTAGWEDQTISPMPIVDYYERVCERDSGLDRTMSYFRLFCVPGCAHGGGKGRLITGSPDSVRTRDRLVAWVEKGVPPAALEFRWSAQKLQVPVATYPGLYVQDDAGKWKRIETPRGTAARIDDDWRRTSLEK